MVMTRNPDARDVLNQIVNDPRYAEVMRVPVISLPQVSLTILALAVFAGATIAALNGLIPIWAAVIFNIIAVYIAFTPLHDASHRAVSSNSLINDGMGVIVGQLLLPGINMTSFRAIHMDHHRYVGQEGRDPDTGFVNPPKWAGVAYLMFADFHWVGWYLRYGRHYWSKKVAAYIVLMLVVSLGVQGAFLMSPYWLEFLLLYIIPQRIGLGIVAYTFAHIQHPEGLTWEEAPFQSTLYVRGNSPWRRLMFGQEEHIIHHLVPHVPWFKYKRVWDLANGVLRRQGIPGRGWLEGPGEIHVPGPEARAPIAMEVAAVRDDGDDIRVIDFVAAGTSPFAIEQATAGAHIDVHLDNGLIRQYSVVATDPGKNRITIAVKRDPNSRGGSAAMHRLAVGDRVMIGKPRNNFVLYENAEQFVLIAGGIGITPLFAMAKRLKTLGKPFALHVCARNDAAVPFRQNLSSGLLAPHCHIHLDGDNGRSSINLDQVLAQPAAGKLLYLCGPQAFMNWLRDEARNRGWADKNIRIESFSAVFTDDDENRDFNVTLARANRSVVVKADQTIIDALAKVGIDVPYACMQGTCGTCVTPVVEGNIEHRDAFLSEEEKAEGKHMCLCVSRSANGGSLTIDL